MPLGSTQANRRLNAGSTPTVLAHTVSPRTKLVLGVLVQVCRSVSYAKVSMVCAGLTVNNGGLPIIELSAGVTLPIFTFPVPASPLPVGKRNEKNCGFCVKGPPL